MKIPINTKIGRKVAYPTGNNSYQFQGQRSRSPQINARVADATWLMWNRSTNVTAVGGIPCPWHSVFQHFVLFYRIVYI